jgi:hypothetical protein
MATAAAGPETESKEGWTVAWKSHDGITHCTRCGGLMVTEQFIDLPAHRCVQCGEIVDPVILQNRQRGITTGMN